MPIRSESNNPRATARYLEGMSLLEAFRNTRDWHELEDAERQFSEAALLDPDYDPAQFYLGVAQEMIGKHEQAATQFESLFARLPADQVAEPELLYNLGLSYFHQYRRPAYERAVRYVQMLIDVTLQQMQDSHSGELSPQAQSVRLLAEALLAQVYSHMSIPPAGMSTQQYLPEAESNFRNAVDIASRALLEFESKKSQLDAELVRDIGWSLHNAIGHALLYAFRRRQGSVEFADITNHFDIALQFDPQNYRVLSNLGSSHFFWAEAAKRSEGPSVSMDASIAEHLEASRRYFHQVLQIKPHYDFAYYRLAKIAILLGNQSEAKDMLNLARQHPNEMTRAKLDQLEKEIQCLRIFPST